MKLDVALSVAPTKIKQIKNRDQQSLTVTEPA